MSTTKEFETTVHVIQKSPTQQVRFMVKNIYGKNIIDLRVFILWKDTYIPTKKGVTIPSNMFQDFLNGIFEIGGALDEKGIKG
jgi:hypothetical protein|tara:strand:+ start:225 stop:473 length:249 start_codon:yes stop_codon:yes gene_type:complete